MIDLRTRKNLPFLLQRKYGPFGLPKHSDRPQYRTLEVHHLRFENQKWTDFAPGSLSQPIMDFMSPD